MKYDEAERMGQLLTEALNTMHSGKWSIYVSRNSFDPSILERDGVRKEVRTRQWTGPEGLRDEFFKVALTMIPAEEIEAKTPRRWFLIWGCLLCDKKFDTLSGEEATEDKLNFIFNKPIRLIKHSCGDGFKGRAECLGIRPATPEEVEKHLEEKG